MLGSSFESALDYDAEPSIFDETSNDKVIDWVDLGAVTPVKNQG